MAIADERRRGSASVRTRSRRGASPNARGSMCRRLTRSSITRREGAKTGAAGNGRAVRLMQFVRRRGDVLPRNERRLWKGRRLSAGGHTRRHPHLATTRARVSRSLGRRKIPRADHQRRDRLTPHGRAEARDPWLRIARRRRAVLDSFPSWRSGARETSAGS